MTYLSNYKPLPDEYEPKEGDTVLIEVEIESALDSVSSVKRHDGTIILMVPNDEILAIKHCPFKIGDQVHSDFFTSIGTVLALTDNCAWVQEPSSDHPWSMPLDELERVYDPF